MYNRLLPLLLILVALTACNRDPNVAKQKYLENGNKYFEKEKYKEALIMYRNAIKRDAKFGEAYYRAALAELKMQRLADAARNLLRAVDLDPKNLDAHNRLVNLFLNAYTADKRRPAQLLQELQNLSQRLSKNFPNGYDDARLKGYLALFQKDGKLAEQEFARANKLKPNQPDLVLVYMQTLMGLGKTEEGEKLGRDLIAQTPSALNVYDALFFYYLQARRPEDAEAVLRLKTEKNPKNPDGFLQLAAYYYGQKKPDAMLASLKKLSSDKQNFPRGPMMVGDFFLRIRDLDKAKAEYEQGIAQASEVKLKHDYQKRMVEILIKQNKVPEAQKVVAEILKEDSKDPEAIAIRASLTMLSGTKEQLQQAVADLQGVVSKMPGNPVIRYNLGRALLAQQNIPAAKVQFEEAIKLRPDYLLPRMTLAQLTLRSREYPKVVQMAQDILSYDKTNVQARLLRSQALIGMRDFQQARSDLEKTLTEFPNVPEAQLQVAALDLQDKNYKAAEGSFQKLYQQSNDPRAFMGLIDAYVAQGQEDTAIRLLRETAQKDPSRIDYRTAIGNISLNRRDYPTAIAEYKTVVDNSPTSSDAWLRLGEAYRRSGQRDQATASFKKAKDIAPNNVNPYVLLALTYEEIGQRSEARPLYEQILRLQPENTIALNNLAFILAENGSDLDTALTMVQKARLRRPNDNDVSDTLGWIYIKKDLPDSAIEIFRDLVQKQPNRATYHYHLAMALFQKGDKPQARKSAELALSRKPSKEEEVKIRELISKLG